MRGEVRVLWGGSNRPPVWNSCHEGGGKSGGPHEVIQRKNKVGERFGEAEKWGEMVICVTARVARRHRRKRRQVKKRASDHNQEIGGTAGKAQTVGPDNGTAEPVAESKKTSQHKL